MEERGMRKVMTGRVVSNKMEKTVVVAVESLVRHPLYQRTIRRTKNFKAHGPISKDKRWRVIEILEKSKQI